jgi:hypothetical protein
VIKRKLLVGRRSRRRDTRFQVARQFVTPGRIMLLRPLKTAPKERKARRDYDAVWITTDVIPLPRDFNNVMCYCGCEYLAGYLSPSLCLFSPSPACVERMREGRDEGEKEGGRKAEREGERGERDQGEGK